MSSGKQSGTFRAAALASALMVVSSAQVTAQECLRPSGTKANWVALGSGLAEGSHKAVTVELGRNFLPDLAVFAETDRK